MARSSASISPRPCAEVRAAEAGGAATSTARRGWRRARRRRRRRRPCSSRRRRRCRARRVSGNFSFSLCCSASVAVLVVAVVDADLRLPDELAARRVHRVDVAHLAGVDDELAAARAARRSARAACPSRGSRRDALEVPLQLPGLAVEGDGAVGVEAPARVSERRPTRAGTCSRSRSRPSRRGRSRARSTRRRR